MAWPSWLCVFSEVAAPPLQLKTVPQAAWSGPASVDCHSAKLTCCACSIFCPQKTCTPLPRPKKEEVIICEFKCVLARWLILWQRSMQFLSNQYNFPSVKKQQHKNTIISPSAFKKKKYKKSRMAWKRIEGKRKTKRKGYFTAHLKQKEADRLFFMFFFLIYACRTFFLQENVSNLQRARQTLSV